LETRPASFALYFRAIAPLGGTEIRRNGSQ